MFTPKKPWQRAGEGVYNSPSKRVPLKGFFSDGIWHCNCDPRLPAAFFEVKKDGPNHGRWFYTCQLPKETGCGLFLWKDDAMKREMYAVIGNTRSERDTAQTPRMAPVESKDDDDEFGEWSLSPDEERKLSQAVEQVEQASPLPETPRKAVKTNVADTPGSKREWEKHVLPTPSTGANYAGSIGKGENSEDAFATPATKRLQGGMFGGNERMHMRSPSATPTPSRFRDGTATSETSNGLSINPYDISEEVLDLLKDQKIDDETLASLELLLNRHAMKISGIAKGRDITRVALKAKDARIAELQQKISTLEGQREMDKTVIRHFESDMSESVARRKRPGRGRGQG